MPQDESDDRSDQYAAARRRASAFGGTGGRLLACALGNKQPVEGLRDE